MQSMCLFVHTGDEDDDPDMEEEPVRDPRVLCLPPVHDATGAPVEVHLGLRLQKRRRCPALDLTAGHLVLFNFSLTYLCPGGPC